MTPIKTLISITIACLIVACGKQETNEVLDTGLIYCSEGNPETFNPQLVTSATTLDVSAQQIYSRLLEFNPIGGLIEPGLARSWHITTDGLLYTLNLRRGVKFHSTDYFTPTRDFNADDVLFTYNRWRLADHPFNQTNGGVYPYFDSLQLAEQIEFIKKTADYQVQFKLRAADSSFLSHLATDYASVLSKEYGQQLIESGDMYAMDNKPVGTGPFYYVGYQKDEYVRMRSFAEYWGGAPNIEQLVYDITPQSSARLAKLLTGECDVIAYPVASEMQVLEDTDGIALQVQPAVNVGFWAFNTLKPPFDNPRVRQALAMAIDRKAIMKAIYYGTAFPASSVLPPTSWAYHPNLSQYTYSPEKAKQILRNEGLPEGFKMNIWAMPIERPYNPNALKMAELISANLAQVGIEVKVISFEWSTFRRRLLDFQHDSVLIGWSADTPDPDSFFRPLLSCTSAIVGSNRSSWCNPEFDNEINLALKNTDMEKRRIHYHNAQEILHQQMPVIPIAHSMRFQARKDNIFRIGFSPYAGVAFKSVEKD